MAAPSTTVFVVFVLTVAAVAAAWIGAGRAARSRREATSPALVAGVLFVAIVVPGLLAWFGWLDRYAPPPPALLLVAAITIGTVVLALSSFGERLALSASVAGLVGYQAFRIPVEWVLHRLYLEGIVPVQMTWAGRNFDIFTGIGALVLAVLLLSGRRMRRTVFAWNLAGLGLLANIVTIAVLSTPVPFRLFTNDPPNLLPGAFPFVWLPTFLVQAALFGHLVVFRALAAEARGHR